ncbi:Holliday junction resolvase RuvX [Candidatus Karelsulcia muelleri]|uniref:Holliday junction resolvase RuvX n=1 Tax=Candidatus Karelsulcia muelleri TaxID=336810 RepID=UPI0009BD3B5A|nr:Holliday junction resolvase RuvX [Candidatus Karelsulcia muelleri]MBU6942251.1 Holliday junction resolvase RuvX [Candidatus Karelsulcia muelleri]
MSKILCIDYGKKRIGLSITNSIRSIAFGLDTVNSNNIICTLYKYLKYEDIDTIVIGLPIRFDNSLFPIEKDIKKFIKIINNKYPKLIIKRIDERFTSKIANYYLINTRLKRKINQLKKNKNFLDKDKISATILLQEYIKY